MTPKTYYQKMLDDGSIQYDPQQLPVIDLLESIYQSLKAEKTFSFIDCFRKPKGIRGLYLWGNVGAGKTFMMDCFYQCVSVPKLRLHFHQFMQRVHAELKILQGTKNPLTTLAKKIAKETRVICFDEFFVSDIADAMLLGELFSHLFTNRVTLVASSNVAPDLLYKDGLQRERFLPAITLLKEHTTVFHLHSKVDYRQRHLHRSGVFYTPLNAEANRNMENAFLHFAQGAAISYDPISICDRMIPVIKRAGSVVWFDFEVICGRPRSQMDYLALTQQFHTILVQNVRAVLPNENNLALSFIYLVDILYDSHCRLVISSAVDMDKIYTDPKNTLPFARTCSRLAEMQAQEYVYPEIKTGTLTNL